MNRAFIIFLFLLYHGCSSPPKYSDNLIQGGEKHFKNLRQLTFSGENAEAYFNLDGTKLIYQAHDGDSLCDQIYIMDIKTGNSEMVQQEMGQPHVAFSNTQKQRFYLCLYPSRFKVVPRKA
jgi:hypothetical protein